MAIQNQTIQKLLNPKLEESYDPQALIALIPMQTDQIVADIGAGPGRLSIPLAKYLYGGQLHALDPNSKMLETLREQTERFRLHNVNLIETKLTSLPLDNYSVNGVLMSDVLSEGTHVKRIFKESARILKRGGWLAIVEWIFMADTPRFGPPMSKRWKSEDILEIGSKNQLTRIRSRNLGLSHHVVVFRK